MNVTIDMDAAKLIWLAVLIGFFVGLAVMLLRVDRNDTWKHAHIAQLVLNRYGGLDPVLVAFWIGVGLSVLATVYSLLRPVGPMFVAVFTIVTGNFTLPLLFKVAFNKAPPSSAPPPTPVDAPPVPREPLP